MHKDTFDMYSNYIPNGQTENLERRRDARKKVNEVQLVVAKCRTMESDFQALIENVSSGGIFISTHQRLFVGQEIAMKFDFPDTRNTIMANGEIVRTSFEGAGIRFRMFFKK
jgi:Tfp pilus assembly protein PilZ